MYFYVIAFSILLIWLIAGYSNCVNKKTYMILSLMFLAFIVGFRYETGKDIDTYEKIFNAINKGASYDNIGYGYSIEITYFLITKLITFFHLGFQAVVLVYSLLSFFFIYKGLSNIEIEKHEFAMFIILFFSFEFVTYFVIMRQFLAASIIFFVFTEKKEGKIKLIRNIGLLVLAGFVHSGAFMILPLYCILRVKFLNKNLFKIVLLIIALWMGTSNYAVMLINKIIIFFEKYANYFSRSNFGRSSGSSKIINLLLIFYLSLLLYNEITKDKMEQFSNLSNSILTTFVIYYSSLLLGYFNRAYWYTAISLCIIPVLMSRQIKNNSIKFSRLYCLGIFISFTVYSLYYYLQIGEIEPSMIPYKFNINIF